MPELVDMGILYPKKGGVISKALIILLAISLLPILVVALSFYFLWGGILYLVIWLALNRQFVVFVYSDSPIWKDYIETEILPHIQDRAVILNWSERRHWKHSLAVLAFQYFGGHRNFNPIGMVFRPFRFVKTYRFFKAFHEFKRGDDQKVQQMREKLFQALDS